MIKQSILVFVLLISGMIANAQLDTSIVNREHFISVQSNELIRQVLNFGGSSSTVDNPYLLNYSWNKASTGWGINIGLGITLDNISREDEFSETETKIRENFIRIGLDRKTQFKKRWIFGWGLDIIRQNVKNESLNTSSFGGSGSFTIETENKESGFGFGPRVGLTFMINDRIMLGTEASYYLIGLKSEGVVKSTNRSAGGLVTDTDEVTDEGSSTEFDLKVPSVLNLTFSF